MTGFVKVMYDWICEVMNDCFCESYMTDSVKISN